ncbi:sensor histidine kinase [Spongiimicrobium salis]|uniref:sensor histidine kinase n=1 Tax=Spongiimicrobium salis TaxID=1667022 RepID=UPI00374DF25B
MEFTPKNRNRLFWTLQLVGWGIVNALTFLLAAVFSAKYMLFSYALYTVFGILLTCIYRYYLKKYVTIDWYGKNTILPLFVIMGIAILAFMGVEYGIEYTYEIFFERTPSEEKFIVEGMGVVSIFVGSAIYIVGWTLLYYGIKILLRSNQNRLEEMELKATLKEAQLNTLKGQVNPHFMFNSLNNIRGLMLEDVDRSREMITKLSEMLQYALVKNDVDAIPIAEELEMVENYIALSKIQMEDRLEYAEEIDPDTLKIPIPPMVIQLLIENGVKHGIANLKAGGKVSLKTAIDGDRLCIKVINTGTLKIAENSTQLGLKNIRQRLKLLYGTKAVFSLDEVNTEVVANIKIPLT